ncbi:MAG: hypothetical protein OEV00_04755 [Acidobacteriota bacterium]|nr:hypothetical protein [Acidobacteriota bacterium]MDH3784624.1 hypothetical protein [Acidobacteriota bacterium]
MTRGVRMRKALIVGLLGMSLFLSGASAEEPPSSLPDVMLLFTGDVIGYIDTCGCKRNPAGGLARRAHFTRTMHREFAAVPQLLLDSGNFSDNPTPEGDLKTAALVEGMSLLGYDVVNVGERDVKHGWDRFSARQEKGAFDFISANLVFTDTGDTVLPSRTIVETTSPDGARKIRVGVTGVMRFNPIFKREGPDGREIGVDHPVDRLKTEVAALRKDGVDLVVVLAAVHQSDGRRIAAEVGGVDFLIGSYGGSIAAEQSEANGTWIFYSGNQGKQIGESRVYLNPSGGVRNQSNRFHMLGQGYPADPEMLAFVNAVPVDHPVDPANATDAAGDGVAGR